MDSSTYSREVSGFLFYSKLIWPFHRRLAGSLISKRCRSCIISERHTPLNRDGICSSCASLNKKENLHSRENLQQLDQEMKQILRDSKGSRSQSYDIAILFSGGKDSTYLVKRIRDEYPSHNLLLISVDNTFMSPFALKNIEDLVQKFDLPHIFIRPPAQLYNKMFRHALLHLNERGCSGTVDQFDGDFFHDVARNLAAELRIPVLLSGCSRTQVQRILRLNHFEFSREFESSKRTDVANIPLHDIFSPDEMKFWMNEGGTDSLQRPRLLFPFYVWNLEETEIIRKVSDWGLLPKHSGNPLLTNNQLIPTMAIVDMVKFGYSSFEPEFCQMVREGKADAKFWRNVFELSEYSAKTGRFISKSVDQCLERLSLTREELGIPR